jgi:Glycosyl hydrolase family 47
MLSLANKAYIFLLLVVFTVLLPFAWSGQRPLQAGLAASRLRHGIGIDARASSDDSPNLDTWPSHDVGARCNISGICDSVPCNDGSDGLGCIRDSRERRASVVSAIKWAWDAYSRCAFGADELKPLSCSAHEWLGQFLSGVDSLDTLLLGGLNEVRFVPGGMPGQVSDRSQGSTPSWHQSAR